MEQTAIKWLLEQWPILEAQIPERILNQAEEIEQSNIEQAFNHGRNVGRVGSPGVDGNYYYNQIFKSE